MTDNFSLDNSLNSFYSSFPEGREVPVIGITANYAEGNAQLRDRYYEQVVRAGGCPVILPPSDNPDVLISTLSHIDGLLLSGGGDYNPLWAGEEPSPRLHSINSHRDKPELLLTRLAYNRQLPMLGICRGIQTLAMALDGEVEQDIYMPRQGRAASIKHSQDGDRSEPTHTVRIAEGSELSRLYGNGQATTLAVNSFHHQAVRSGGKRLKVTATAPDGVVEAIESAELKSVMGVQWHPEWLGDEGLPLFRWLVARAAEYHRARRLQEQMVTLDTHCDTPMFFPQGVDFMQRDSRILYDLHKMHDGGTGAVTMVAYLPQPKMGETFSSKIDLAGILRHNPQLGEHYPSLLSSPPSITPKQYADLIFDKLEDLVAHNGSYVSIARIPADLYEDQRKGRKSIMLGIENGLALEHKLANVRHFAQRGVVYITLCHNGDNDICDSARGCSTHNGVSQFGQQVIKEMNRCGLMVDLSHAAEKSFYDALDISDTPIVCSHSNCRALCDVPRNLTDDQLRALAAHGGVAQITLYHGFLRRDGEATLYDALDHIDHAVSIMGIEHVGLGTDFDGDGTVLGCADASELINFTIGLMRRHYSDHDISLIWGGNWLRVMQEVQNHRTE